MIERPELFVEVPAIKFCNDKDNLSSLSQPDWDKLPLLLMQVEARQVPRLDL